MCFKQKYMYIPTCMNVFVHADRFFFKSVKDQNLKSEVRVKQTGFAFSYHKFCKGEVWAFLGLVIHVGIDTLYF